MLTKAFQIETYTHTHNIQMVNIADNLHGRSEAINNAYRCFLHLYKIA